MRIAIINRNFSRTGGGAESYAVAIAEQLAARHEVHVFSQESNRPLSGVAYHRVFCLAKKPRWLNQLVFAFSSWWQTRRGFDVVHSHENTWHGQVQTIHVRPLRYNLFHGQRGFRRALRWLKVCFSVRLATYVWLESARFRPLPERRIVAASEALRGECEQTYPASRRHLSVITPGTQLHPQAMSADAARLQLGLPLAKPLLLFVANDYRRKGLDALLQALALLPAEVELAVAGNPASIPTYRQQAVKLGLGPRVHFLGSLDDLTPAYRASDCLVHPTLEDTFAMVVLEAMSHGLPVVVSGPRYCGISSALQDGREALLLDDPRDAPALARLLQSVLEKSGLAEQLRSHGLAFAQAHSWERAALEYEALYQQVLSPIPQ